jgi:tyrosyl-tRNA synthetase
MSIPDELVPRWQALTTGWHPDRVATETAAFEAGTGPTRNAAKRTLARTIVDLYHGPGAGELAEAEFDRVFKLHAAPTDVAEIAIPAAELPLPVSRLLARCGLVAGNKDGVRQVEQGAVRLDGNRLGDPAQPMGAGDVDGRTLQVGKRKWARVRVSR